jgi:predicted acetyltransferase
MIQSMQIIKAEPSHKDLLANLMQLYLHDLSVYTGDTVEEDGKFDLGEYFHLYWKDSDRFPYLCLLNGRVAGFALVREIGNDSFSIAEFFVLRSHRGTGLAAQFAKNVFQRHHGQWEVAELDSNIPAQKFWRKIIASYSAEGFQEIWSDAHPRGPKQLFRSEKD